MADTTIECPACQQLAPELHPVLFGNGVVDKACRECIDAWQAAWGEGWLGKVGKKAAGALLDGREWKQTP